MYSNEMLVGRTIEQNIGKEIGKLYAVIPLANLPPTNGQGPRTNGENGGGIVLPDFAVAARTYGYIDVKWKTTSLYFRNWDRHEHGIELKTFLHYRTIEGMFQRRVALVIVEGLSKRLLAATLDDLQAVGQPREGTWPNTGTPSINWDRSAFVEVGRFDIPNDDLTEMQIYISHKPMNHLLRQLALPYEEPISCYT